MDHIHQIRAKAELITRFSRELSHDSQYQELFDAITSVMQSRIISTQTAFEIADIVDVMQVYADGTDSQLDDLETEDEYYPDKTKSWPDIETIMVIDGNKL